MKDVLVIAIPPASKFCLTYQGKQKKVYTVSAPIEMTKDSFTAYAFGKGVRTFLFNKIVSFEPVFPK